MLPDRRPVCKIWPTRQGGNSIKLMVQVTELQLSWSLKPDMWNLPQCGCHSSQTHASQPHVQFVGTATVVDRLSERTWLPFESVPHSI